MIILFEHEGVATWDIVSTHFNSKKKTQNSCIFNHCVNFNSFLIYLSKDDRCVKSV